MFQITSLAYKIYDDSLQTEYSKEKLYYESVSWGGRYYIHNIFIIQYLLEYDRDDGRHTIDI